MANDPLFDEATPDLGYQIQKQFYDLQKDILANPIGNK